MHYVHMTTSLGRDNYIWIDKFPGLRAALSFWPKKMYMIMHQEAKMVVFVS
jgi:hypothetical protein